MPLKGCDFVAQNGEILPYRGLDVADVGLHLGHVGRSSVVAAVLARFERTEVQQQLEDLCL
ncbi:hypothetical protein ACIBQ1_60465 [Nonomuraea sp. NPDC050153]|uniref:hypothetical protein n=1 Tax=Nonomuraea sp. NPDC050153 TaxID=3364359 RepID=UPI00378D64B3